VGRDQQGVSVLNPQGRSVQAQNRRRLAPRLDRLEGKTVYLVDAGFGGGYEFLDEMERWFARNRPSVKTVLRRKRGNMYMEDPELWDEIKQKGDAAILGVGG
jgi:hypothetical protein